MAALDANALKDRATRLVKSFAPAQLAVIALLGVVTVIGGMAFLRWASTPSYEVLFADLEPKDASTVVEKLKADGVPYQLGSNGTAVLVPSGKVYDLRLSLSASGLPQGGTVGYELLDKHGLTTSEFRQRVDYQRALEGELSRTLMALQGVESASVHLAIPAESVFTDDKQATRASVLLQTAGTLGDDAVTSVVNLVASSVPDLAPEAVTVADTAGRVLSSAGTASGAASNRQLRLADDYESQLSADASGMLAQVFGPGHAVVRVSAQLNFDESERETETYDPASSSVIREQTNTESFKGAGTPPGGTLGVDAAPVTGTGTNNEYQKSDTSKEYGVDRVVERSKVAPGKVERLSVAVVLDGSAKPVPAADKVQSLVAAALGVDAARGDTIVVDTIKFDTAVKEAAEKAQATEAGKESTAKILDYARTGVGALALVIVLVFLVLASRRSRSEAVDIPALGPGSLAAAIAASQTPAGALAAASHTPAGLVPAGNAALNAGQSHAATPAAGDDDVLRLIDSQPEEVAVLLRGWLADRRS